MKKMKFRIPNPEVSRQVQEKLFEMGYEWSIRQPKTPQYLNAPYLYSNSVNISYGIEEDTFLREQQEEVSWEVFLGLKREVKINNKKMKKAFHTFEFEGRKVTISAVETELGVSVGYAVCMPQDEFKQELARKISLGRALSCAKLDSYRLDPKLKGNYGVLKAIATSWERAVRKDPELVIKGFKKDLIELTEQGF